MISAVISRLKDQVPSLRHVDGAKGWEEVRARNGVPQTTPAAYVIPLGMSGQPVQSNMAGAFTQGFEDVIGVVLMIRNDRPSDAEVLGALDVFIRQVAEAVAGWAPSDEVSSFRLLRGNNLPGVPNTVVYQIDFAIQDQLRIFS